MPALEHQDLDLIADALVHVAIAGDDQRLPARRGLNLGQRPQQVVGLEGVAAHALPAKLLEETRRLGELPVEVVGRRGPGSVVVGIGLDAVSRRLGAEAEHDRPRPTIGGHAQGYVGRPSRALTGRPALPLIESGKAKNER